MNSLENGKYADCNQIYSFVWKKCLKIIIQIKIKLICLISPLQKIKNVL